MALTLLLPPNEEVKDVDRAELLNLSGVGLTLMLSTLSNICNTGYNLIQNVLKFHFGSENQHKKNV